MWSYTAFQSGNRLHMNCRQGIDFWLISWQEGRVSMEHRPDMLKRAEPRICAFDIETTKLPLQFPNAEHDQVSCCHQLIRFKTLSTLKPCCSKLLFQQSLPLLSDRWRRPEGASNDLMPLRRCS